MIVLIIIFTFAIVLHEWGHAYVAYKCGDPTPKMQGRLSLNPIKHLDVFGTLALFIFGIGWAKPVEFNPYALKDPKPCIVKIALAGPLMNFIQVVFYAILPFLLPYSVILDISKAGILVNLALALFNLLPFWPLDGFNALMYLAPDKDREFFIRSRYASFIIFLILLVTGITNNILDFLIIHFFKFLL